MIMIIINDDVNMVQSGAHLVGEILPPSGGRTGSPSIVSWKATIYEKESSTENVKLKRNVKKLEV